MTYPPGPLPLSREGGVKVREGALAPSLESLPLKERDRKERPREVQLQIYYG
jgi:hypothetical protein